jgi:hypothetical protein
LAHEYGHRAEAYELAVKGLDFAEWHGVPPNARPWFVRVFCSECNRLSSNNEVSTMTIETPEQAAQAQAQMEDFARLAHDVKIAVEALEDAFCGLADWPEHLFETMPELSAAAKTVADNARDWAKVGNADFEP